MADQFDPCECVWSHENAMQRLINMLRNSQDVCNDNECLTSPLGPQSDPSASQQSTTMLIMMAWLIIATALFLFRPSSLRRQPDQKGPSRDQDGNPPPPAAPIS